MSIINLKEKTINAKIVYYGTALGGKTTSLKHVHKVIDPEQKIELVSLNTEKDRTLFFDFLPISLGKIGDFSVRLQGFTVPGQVKYNLTRKYVLTGADAVVLVVDSQRSQLESNIAALENLKENLLANGLDYGSIPLVFQYNKRDLDGLVPPEELDRLLNDRGIPAFETIATRGDGVFEAFIEVSKGMMDHIAGQYRIQSDQSSIGEVLQQTLSRVLRRARAEGGEEEPPEEPAPREEEPGEDQRGHGLVHIHGEAGDDDEESDLPSSEDLLKKAVDSNIEIARLYGEVNEMKNRLRDRVRELTALHEVGKTMTSVLDVDRLLQTVLESATRCLGSEHGSLILVRQDGKGLIEKVVNGFLADPLAQSFDTQDSQSFLLQLAMESDGVLVSDEENREILSRIREQDPRIRSVMLAPLLFKERLDGVITIYFLGGAEERTKEKLRFLSALSSHAAVALENARLVGRIENFNRELERQVRDRTAELRKAYEELKEIDRMKDDFLSSMSHELLTPLTSIQSFSEILLTMEGEERAESLPEFLGIINRESIRLTSRLKDLLDLSQIEGGQVVFERSPVNLRGLLDEIFSTVSAEAREKSLRAVVTTPARDPIVPCDAKWITRALGAVLSNAVKFSDEGGELHVEIADHGDETWLSVRDMGCGIAPEFQSTIFERFKQIGEVLTDKPSGVGLGLPLARLIVEGHDGRIWVESRVGQGSRFTIALPSGPSPDAGDAPTDAPDSAIASNA